MDQGSNKNHSPAYNFTPTVTKFCVMWEGLSLPHDTKFGNCRCKIVDSRSFHSWSLIHGLRWSGLIKVGPGVLSLSQVTPFICMMMSSNGNISRVTGPLCAEFTGHRWIAPTKASDAELWCFLWSAPWINGWVNNREAVDLRRHRAHYDIIVMENRASMYFIYGCPNSKWVAETWLYESVPG